MTHHKYLRSALAILLAATTLTLSACTNTEQNKNQTTHKKETTQKKETTNNPYADLKIGVINIGSSKDASGYTYAHTIGIKGMMSTLGLKSSQVIFKDDIPDDNHEIITKALQNCVDAGCNIIFSTSFGFKDATYEMAEKYPNVYFSHCSGDLSNGKNMNKYFGRIYQPFYLLGIAAGLKTQTNKIGFVSAFGKKISECAYCLNAFAMGVDSVNPKAKVYALTINCWDDEKKERVAAEKLVKLGVDVIGQDTDSSTPQIVAEENDIYSVGYNNDTRKEAPESTLVSAIWNWVPYYTSTVKSVASGNWDVADFYGGIREDTVSITELSAFNHGDASKEIENVTKKFKSNTWDVFTGIISTNTGKTIGAPGTSLTDYTIQFETDWFYKNIKEVK